MIYFDDLLQDDNICDAVSRIAGEFREKHNFPEVRQLEWLSRMSKPPRRNWRNGASGLSLLLRIHSNSGTNAVKDRTFSGKLGMAIYKGYEVELLEPGIGSAFYKSCVDGKGRMVASGLSGK